MNGNPIYIMTLYWIRFDTFYPGRVKLFECSPASARVSLAVPDSEIRVFEEGYFLV